jgi:hypothetical protein
MVIERKWCGEPVVDRLGCEAGDTVDGDEAGKGRYRIAVT